MVFGTFAKTLEVVGIASLILIIIPQLLYQAAIKELQPISIAIVIPFMPVLVFFISYWHNPRGQNIYNLIGIVTLLAVTLWSCILRRHEEKKAQAGVNTPNINNG